MSGNTFFIETWGCQMNDLDTQRLSGSLKLRGWTRVENEEEASLILLNTCSIREKAEQKVFSRLGHLRELKQDDPREQLHEDGDRNEIQALVESAAEIVADTPEPALVDEAPPEPAIVDEAPPSEPLDA